MEGIIFQSPYILGGFVLALVLLIFELKTESTGFILPVISLAISIAVTVYSILCGATLQEITIILMVFVIINITTFKRNGEK